jgi:hypothetical protein
MKYHVVQLNRLAETRPKAVLGTNSEAYFKYYDVSNLAIDLLKNPRDEATESRLSTLINELGIIIN